MMRSTPSRQTLETGRELRDPLDTERAVYFCGECLLDQSRVSGIVLNEKYDGGFVGQRDSREVCPPVVIRYTQDVPG